jgi:Uma2 family endonuclease
VAGRLFRLLADHLERHVLGEVFYEVDLLFATGQFLAPDLLVVPRSNEAAITTRGIECVPALVVEVLSPSSEHHDRVTKPRRFLEFGVPEYWLVDLDDVSIWRWTRVTGEFAPNRESGRLLWRIAPDAPPLEIDVAQLMRSPE